MTHNELDRIVFLAAPESLRGSIETETGGSEECEDHDHEHPEEGASGFSIDPDILIPVEIPEGSETLNLRDLSGEMILSGMLRVIAAGAGATEHSSPERLNYYRRFVLALKPHILAEFTEAAILKTRNGCFDQALEIFDILRGLFPASPVVLLNRALALEERAGLHERQGSAEAAQEYRAAAAAYQEILNMQPPFPDAQFNAGFFYLGQKDFRKAKACFSQYVDIAQDGGKKRKAASIIKDIEESGLEDESFCESYEFIQAGREAEALEAIRDFLERRPSVWNGWFVLGWALRRLSRWQDGAAALGRAVELGGDNSDTRNELAICLMESGDLAAARRELETALRGDPENVKIISNLGVLAAKNGDDDEAAAFFRAALEIDPGDEIAKKFLAGS